MKRELKEVIEATVFSVEKGNDFTTITCTNAEQTKIYDVKISEKKYDMKAQKYVEDGGKKEFINTFLYETYGVSFDKVEELVGKSIMIWHYTDINYLYELATNFNNFDYDKFADYNVKMHSQFEGVISDTIFDKDGITLNLTTSDPLFKSDKELTFRKAYKHTVYIQSLKKFLQDDAMTNKSNSRFLQFIYGVVNDTPNSDKIEYGTVEDIPKILEALKGVKFNAVVSKAGNNPYPEVVGFDVKAFNKNLGDM